MNMVRPLSPRVCCATKETVQTSHKRVPHWLHAVHTPSKGSRWTLPGSAGLPPVTAGFGTIERHEGPSLLRPGTHRNAGPSELSKAACTNRACVRPPGQDTGALDVLRCSWAGLLFCGPSDPPSPCRLWLGPASRR